MKIIVITFNNDDGDLPEVIGPFESDDERTTFLDRLTTDVEGTRLEHATYLLTNTHEPWDMEDSASLEMECV